MPTHGLAHCTDPESCHHCHITAPIPMAKLIKTHPLRPKLPSPRLLADATKRLAEEEGSSGFSSDNVPRSKSKTRSLPKQRDRDVPQYGDEILRRVLQERENEIEFLKTRHAYPVNGSPKRDYDRTPPSPPHGSPPPKRSPITNSSRLKHYHNQHRNYSPKVNSSPRRTHRSEVNQSPNIRDRYPLPISHNNSPILSSSLRRDGMLEDYPRMSPDIILTSSKSKFNPLFSEGRHPTFPRKEFGTQTSRVSALYGELLSDYSSLNLYKDAKKRQQKSCLNLPTGLLLAGYALLIVIAVAIGVVLSQQGRFFQGSPQRSIPRPINIPGAIRVSGPTQSVPGGPARRRIRVQGAQRAPSPVFTQADFDYLDTGVFDEFINQPRPAPRPVARPAPRPAPRPSSIFPPFSSFAPSPQPKSTAPPAPVARPAPTPAPAPRAPVSPPVQAPIPVPRRSGKPRKQSPEFRQRFDLSGFQQEGLVEETTTKQPIVEILQSWSNVDSDGSFSYGYINSDGSFKNETRGADCVSRGIYGYRDVETGEIISHPYETGIPCDPNAVDYFYDYETGAITADDNFADTGNRFRSTQG